MSGHISVYSEISGSFFKHKMRYLMVSIRKRIHYSCEGEIEKSVSQDHRLPSLGKPRDAKRDPRNEFFYPTLTLMIESYNPDQHQEYSILEIKQSELTKMFLKLPCGCNPGLIYFTSASISRPIKTSLPVYTSLVRRRSDIVACEQQRLRPRL